MRTRHARTGGVLTGLLQPQLAGFSFHDHRPCAVTPLHVACIAGNLPLVALLLRHGARADVASVSGTTPIECARVLHGTLADDVQRLLSASLDAAHDL